MRRFLMYWALAGILVPLLLLIVNLLQPESAEWQLLAIVLWPTSLSLMAAEGTKSAALQIVILSVAIAVNVSLYTALGAALWLLRCVARRLPR